MIKLSEVIDGLGFVNDGLDIQAYFNPDKNEIFYLMMKGISYDKANELLVKGFLKSHIGGD